MKVGVGVTYYRCRAKKNAEAFWEKTLVIFPFLSFFIRTVYIPPNVGQYKLIVFELWGIPILSYRH